MDFTLITIMIAVVAIVAIVLGIGNDIFQRVMRYKERQMEITAEKTAEQAAQYAAKAERLEQRVRVLERLATDGDAKLAAEIDDLRDAKTDGERLQ